MADEDHDFSTGSAGASLSVPVQASSLRKSHHVLIKEHPCKIVEMSSSKTGKHGHAKIHFVAIDIFDGKKYEDICPSTHNMQAPKVNREECQAIGIDDDDFVTLVMNEGERDIKATDSDIADKIREMIDDEGSCLATVLSSMGQEKIITCKKEL